ncbi:MAG TPA: hypothetical protein VJQ56_03570 [Blastocatellia bacterium]|nr:hypothetical protein [Blastocatellia bacterium]
MKRAAPLFSLIIICAAASCMAFGQSNARPEAAKVCPFSIVGVWRSEVTTQTTPVFFSFSPEGWVRLLGHSANTPADEFEVIAEVSYKLNKPSAPKGIEFMTPRGNDVFQPGMTMLKISEYSDDSFTTVDQVTEQKTRWVREKTHRYFLTFAARDARLPDGGPAFAMWTVMDARGTRVEALGLNITRDKAGKAAPVFETIPIEVYERITQEEEKDKKRDKGENVIARFELTQAEFETTYKTYKNWSKQTKSQTLPQADPYLNAVAFLAEAFEGLNQCGEKARLYKPTAGERDQIVSGSNPSQRPLEFIKAMRKRNDELHVADRAFPWGWRPMIQSPAQ